MDSKIIIFYMVNQLLTIKYNNITFYSQNLGGYDIIFILGTLYAYNENKEDKYDIKERVRDGKIIKIRTDKGKISFTIKDSYCILNDNLKELGKSF